MRPAAYVLILALTSATQCWATEKVSTAAFMLPYCKMGLANSSDPNWYEPLCYGTVEALSYVGSRLATETRFCAPNDLTPELALRVVIGYVEARRNRLQENFKELALEAFRDAWPCADAPKK